MRRWLTIFAFLFMASAALAAHPARAQGPSPVAAGGATYTFRESILFWGELQPGLDVQRVIIQVEGGGITQAIIVEAAIGADGIATYELNLNHQFVPAFTDIRYQFFVTLASGERLQSEQYSLFYMDNRFEWESLANDSFRVHWYIGDETFALTILDIAQRGLTNAENLLATELSSPVDIFVYGRVEDYQVARGQLGNLWAGGHVNPELGVVIVSLPPEPSQKLEAERKIPHEISHLVLYRAADGGAANIPLWLNEGIASTLETNPSPDYAYLLELAVENDTVLSLADLCDSFPRDASGALLAYAESESFVSYIEELYGPAGVQTLVDSYARGAGCEFGPQVAPFHQSLTQLERNWRTDSLLENPYAIFLKSNRSWLVIIGLIWVWPALILFLLTRRKKRE